MVFDAGFPLLHVHADTAVARHGQQCEITGVSEIELQRAVLNEGRLSVSSLL